LCDWQNKERFQVLPAASMKFRVFWDVAPCSHVEIYRRFRDAYCLPSSGRSPWWWRQYVYLKRRSISTWLHGATSQKTPYICDLTSAAAYHLNALSTKPLTKLKPLARIQPSTGAQHFHQPNPNAVLIPSRPGRKVRLVGRSEVEGATVAPFLPPHVESRVVHKLSFSEYHMWHSDPRPSTFHWCFKVTNRAIKYPAHYGCTMLITMAARSEAIVLATRTLESWAWIYWRYGYVFEAIFAVLCR
jgi:hypothetical protein